MLRRQSKRLNFMLFIVICCSFLIIINKYKDQNILLLMDSDEDISISNNETIETKYPKPAQTVKIPEQRPLKSISTKQLIDMQNVEQKIINENLFGPVTQDTIFIAIQVHSRVDNLRYLIDSFRYAKDIDRALLIFSHDVYDAAINELIRSIDFAMALQIFFPYSIQLYPNVFPGTDPRDCKRDIGREKAKELKCRNADFSDTYGHYRESKFTQIKHHWWWKANRIFDELKVTKELKDFRVMFMEEDHFVSPDFIHVYKQIQKLLPRDCPKCNIITLGTYAEQLLDTTFNKIDIAPWQTNLHNMGMSFNKSTWLKVRNCAEHFCQYDEYNWDYSLLNIDRKCLKQKLYTGLSRGPRIFHVGECGVHHSKANCDVQNVIQKINSTLERAQKDRLLYPEDLEIGDTNFRHPTNELINNGGWADKRDQCLCLEMTANARKGDCRTFFPEGGKLNDL